MKSAFYVQHISSPSFDTIIQQRFLCCVCPFSILEAINYELLDILLAIPDFPVHLLCTIRNTAYTKR